jgi:hypothetical protein
MKADLTIKAASIVVYNMHNAEIDFLCERLKAQFPDSRPIICADKRQLYAAIESGEPLYLVIAVENVHHKDVHLWNSLADRLPNTEIVFYSSNPSLRYLMDNTALFRLPSHGFTCNRMPDTSKRIHENGAMRKIAITQKRSIILLPQDDIVYFESNLRKLVIQTPFMKYELYCKLGDVEKKNLPGFVRCHKSFIVNLRHVKKKEYSHFLLHSGDRIPISQSKVAFVDEELRRYVESNPNIVMI